MAADAVMRTMIQEDLNYSEASVNYRKSTSEYAQYRDRAKGVQTESLSKRKCVQGHKQRKKYNTNSNNNNNNNMGSEQSRPTSNKQKKSSLTWNSQTIVKTNKTSINNIKPRENSIDLLNNQNINDDHINLQNIPEDKSFRQLFSDLELDVLFSTWPLLSQNPIRTGCLIFKNAFEIHPKLSTFFPFG
ncbi:unnamed protein product [Schistosoma mattheei]|uniref:Uncharacterized protein n=1 Tax=Schistosoma mattheei TaxID=31246 RepID=A0A183NT76_9TREM|nr:unnamed protein product [Schistosoma mattheei]